MDILTSIGLLLAWFVIISMQMQMAGMRKRIEELEKDGKTKEADSG